MARGLDMAMFLVAVSLAVAVVGGLGFFAAADTGGAPGINGSAEEVNESVGGQVDSQDFGGSGVSDITLTPIRVLTAFWTVIAHTSAVAQWFGVPEAAADAIQTMVRISFGLVILMVARGMIFDG